MKHSTTVRSVGATATALVLSGLAVSPSAAQPVTTVTVNVQGCEGCSFVVHNGRNPEKAWDAFRTTDPVTGGVTSFQVPSKITPFLSLEVVHPQGYASENAVSFVAFGWEKWSKYYPGTRGWTGNICWGKRQGPSATLNIVVTEYMGRFPPGTTKQPFIRARLAKLPRAAEAGINGTPSCPEYRGT